MKRKITLLSVLAMIGLSAFSYVGGSHLQLKLFNDGNFSVVVDGITYRQVGSVLNVNNLDPGTHRVRVFEHFYGRRGHRQGRNEIYFGSVNVPFRSKVIAKLTPNNGLRVQEIIRLNNAPNRYRSNLNGRSDRARPRAANRYNAFDNTLLDLRSSRFDSDKIRIAKHFTRSHRISSHQVAQMMRQFSFESNKLELAIFAHRFVQDPGNYHQVRQQLRFQSSKQRLNKSIRNRY